MLLVLVVGCGDCGVLYMRVLFDLVVNCLFLVCWLRSCCGLILVMVLVGVLLFGESGWFIALRT